MSDDPKRPRSALSILLQITGFLIGLAALMWCIQLALQPHNKEALLQLRGISIADATALLALTILSVALNGLCFWTTVKAKEDLKPVEVIATNCIATLLAFVPFKASVFFRILIHNRRDRIPLLTIGSWFAAVGLGALMVVGPLTAASLWRKQIDVPWLAAVIIGIPAFAAIAMGVARAVDGPQGLARLQFLASKLPTSWPRKFAGSQAFTHLHAGCGMVASRWFAVGLVIRGLDVLVQAARFYIVSKVLGVELAYSNALLLSGCYFLIGVLYPGGAAGSREGGVTAVAKMLAIPAWQSVAPVALTVTACELIVLVVLSPIAAIILKPWQLRGSRELEQPPAS